MGAAEPLVDPVLSCLNAWCPLECRLASEPACNSKDLRTEGRNEGTYKAVKMCRGSIMRHLVVARRFPAVNANDSAAQFEAM